MGANDVKVTKIQQLTGIGPDGKQLTTIVVTFNVGEHGPFTESFNKAGFNPAAARQALTNFADSIAQLPGVS